MRCGAPYGQSCSCRTAVAAEHPGRKGCEVNGARYMTGGCGAQPREDRARRRLRTLLPGAAMRVASGQRRCR
jgi:hypothetical protein